MKLDTSKYCVLFTNACVVIVSIVAIAVGSADDGTSADCDEFLHTILYIDACWLSATLIISLLDSAKEICCHREARDPRSTSGTSTDSYVGVDQTPGTIAGTRSPRLNSESILCDQLRFSGVSIAKSPTRAMSSSPPRASSPLHACSEQPEQLQHRHGELDSAAIDTAPSAARATSPARETFPAASRPAQLDGTPHSHGATSSANSASAVARPTPSPHASPTSPKPSRVEALEAMRQSGVLPPKPSPSPSKQLSRAESKDQALEAQLRLSGVLPHHLLSEGHPALRLASPPLVPASPVRRRAAEIELRQAQADAQKKLDASAASPVRKRAAELELRQAQADAQMKLDPFSKQFDCNAAKVRAKSLSRVGSSSSIRQTPVLRSSSCSVLPTRTPPKAPEGGDHELSEDEPDGDDEARVVSPTTKKPQRRRKDLWI